MTFYLFSVSEWILTVWLIAASGEAFWWNNTWQHICQEMPEEGHVDVSGKAWNAPKTRFPDAAKEADLWGFISDKDKKKKKKATPHVDRSMCVCVCVRRFVAQGGGGGCRKQQRLCRFMRGGSAAAPGARLQQLPSSSTHSPVGRQPEWVSLSCAGSGRSSEQQEQREVCSNARCSRSIGWMSHVGTVRRRERAEGLLWWRCKGHSVEVNEATFFRAARQQTCSRTPLLSTVTTATLSLLLM